jgi:hypothetical protein
MLPKPTIPPLNAASTLSCCSSDSRCSGLSTVQREAGASDSLRPACAGEDNHRVRRRCGMGGMSRAEAQCGAVTSGFSVNERQ